MPAVLKQDQHWLCGYYDTLLLSLVGAKLPLSRKEADWYPDLGFCLLIVLSLGRKTGNTECMVRRLVASEK
jgi:hypothetical protein